jgi:putative ABC transport system ATP-binding protein
MSLQPIVTLEQVSKHYIEAGKQRIVLDAVNATFYEGEFAVLLGPSGSGKSTVLNVVSGVDETDSGRIRICDTVLTDLQEPALTLFRRDHIGIIFQFFNLIPTLTVLENIILPYELQGHSHKASKARGMAVLEEVELADRANTYPDRLSGGQQQRVAIARALVHEPSLILADEPTGNLDPKTGQTILDLLLKTTRDAGRTLIMATHSMEIVPLADRVFRIEDGQLVEDTQRLREGARIRAELEAQMDDAVAMQMAKIEA